MKTPGGGDAGAHFKIVSLTEHFEAGLLGLEAGRKLW
jgi:hypothetical protein